MRHTTVDVVIIGAGTAGITAFKEASKVTNKIIMIDHGPLGTTCARVGCMPSKALIQVADFYHQTFHFSQIGIQGAEKLQIIIPQVLQHVRMLRDHFTRGTIHYLESLGDQLIRGNAELIDPQTVKVNDHSIQAKAIIIATGSTPIIPKEWSTFGDQVFTTESIFEQADLAASMAVIGGGPVGIELAQALHQLNIEIQLFHSHETLSQLSDPKVNEYALAIFRKAFPVHLPERASVDKNEKDFTVSTSTERFQAKQLLAAAGRKPNLASLQLNKLGIEMDSAGIPLFDPRTMRIGKTALYLAGDVCQWRPVLHEAADAGRIAGYNAVRDHEHCFIRRTPLSIVFTQPNIAIVGQSYKELQDKDVVVGEVSFEDQGRARIMCQNEGILRIYADRHTGELQGAEMICPQGEHLAHQLAQFIQQNMTVFDALKMPFYHPVIEEGMRTALRETANQVTSLHNPLDLVMCDSEAISNLS